MNLSKKLVKFLSLGTLIIGVILTVVSNISSFGAVFAATTAQIGGNANGYQCLGGSSNRWKIESGSAATMPSGYSIETVVVKAGTDCINVYPTNNANSCYSVNVIGDTVTVTKIGQGPTCQDISHLEGTYGIVTVTPTNTPTLTDDPTPTPTDNPTVTPTNTPTPTPFACPTGQVDNGQHICILIDCDGEGTCEVEIGNTPTPTETPTPTATSTPTPTATPVPSSNGGTSTVQSATGSSSDNKSNDSSVPAKAMASTGSFGSLLSNASMLAGLLITSIALTYATKKKK